MTELDISYNEITNGGLIDTAKTIHNNTALQKLDISHNNISRDIATVLGSCLKHNRTLHELVLSWNDDINTTYICISTSKYCTNTKWPYSISHTHTQYFVHRYGSALPWAIFIL